MNLLVPCRKSLEGTVKVPSSQGIFTPEAGGSTLTRYIVLLFAYLRSVLLFSFKGARLAVMAPETASSSSSNGNERPLSLDEYKRYGRQMIMPDFGLPGESKLLCPRSLPSSPAILSRRSDTRS